MEAPACTDGPSVFLIPQKEIHLPQSEDRHSIVPLPFPALFMVSVAVPLLSTYLAGFLIVAALQTLDGDRFAAVVQHLAQSEGNDANSDLAAELAGGVFAMTLAACTIVLSTRRGSTLLPIYIAWRPWHKDRSFLPLLALMITWQALDELFIVPALPSLAELARIPIGTPALLVSLLTAAALSPVAEEGFYRGFVYTNLRAQSGPTTAVAITAVLSAFTHFGDSLAVSLTMLPLALIAGFARERYNSVRPAIYLHAIWNLIAWGGGYFGPTPT